MGTVTMKTLGAIKTPKGERISGLVTIVLRQKTKRLLGIGLADIFGDEEKVPPPVHEGTGVPLC